RKKRRTITGPGQEDEPRGRAGGTAAPAAGARLGDLSAGELDARRKALEQAAVDEKVRSEEEAKRRAEEQRLDAERAAQRAQEEAAAAVDAAKQPPVAEAAPAPASAAPQIARATQAPPIAPKPSGTTSPAAPQARQGGAPATEAPRRTTETPAVKRRPIADETPDEDDRKKKGGNLKGAPRTPVKVADDRRERGKLTVDKLLNDEQRERSLASLRRKRERDARRASGIQLSRDKIVREVTIPEVITIQE